MPETSRFDCQQCDLANNIDDMVQCEGCNKWSHYGCVGFDDGKKEDHWKCRECVTKPTSNNDKEVPSKQGESAQEETSGSTGGPDAVGEHVRLNLKLLDERKAFLLREIELQHTTQLEQRKLQLEKEMWNARYEILNARCEGNSSVFGTGGLSDGANQSNLIAVSQIQQIPAPASTVMVPTVNHRTIPQFPIAETAPIVFQPAPSLPTAVSFFGGESRTFPQPIPPVTTLQSNVQQGQPSTNTMGQATSFMHEFQPGEGANRPGSSTPITTTNWVNTGITSSTQCLPPTISSVGRFGSLPLQSSNVSHPYQVTNSISKIVPVGQVVYSQYDNRGVGPVHPQANTIHAQSSYTPISLPSTFQQPDQYIPRSIHGAHGAPAFAI
ncbi:uncharacterized protein LOC134222011 [Armigeres subalbatus]|uniref:uncharacterized protein LOC134222011 n=1 Tax=Armigeres subalbatus TaxID=124917 RepID=UPI002ED487DB